MELTTEQKKKIPFEHRRVLVLNQSWQALHTVPLEKALTLLWRTESDDEPKARIVDPASYETMTWEDWSKLRPEVDEDKFSSASWDFKIPEVVVLMNFNKVPKPSGAVFNRKTLFRRDDNRCQYCGQRPKAEEWTIDHVVPKSQGGGTTWENCVLACYACNSKKANKTPKQANMKLLKKPIKPDLKHFAHEVPYRIKSWDNFVSVCYWGVTLENDMK